MTEVAADAQRIREEEGKVLQAYLDNKLIWTCGIGFNLERQGAEAALIRANVDSKPIWAAIKAAGPKRKGLRTAQAVITGDQAETLFAADMAQARKDITRIVPSYATHPPVVQAVLIDLLFNMGAGTLASFTTTLGLIAARKYAAAADQLGKNKYRRDVPERYARNHALLTGAQGL